MTVCLAAVLLAVLPSAPTTASGVTTLDLAWRVVREGHYARADSLSASLLATGAFADRAEHSSALELAARLDREREQFSRALERIEQRLRLWRGLPSGAARSECARAFIDRSIVRFRLSLFREAEADLDSAAAVAGDALDHDERLEASLRSARGSTLYHLGRIDEATREHERALAIRRRLLPPDDPELAQSLVNVGTMRWRAGDFDDAVRHDDEAIARLASLGTGAHPLIGEARSRRAYAERDRGDLVTARADWERAIAELSVAYGSDHTSVGRARAALSDLLGTLGDARASLTLAESTLVSARRQLPDSHRDVGRARLAVGEARLALGQRPQARAALEAGERVIEASVGRDNPDLDQALADLAELALAERDTVAARSWLGRRLEINVRALGREHPRVGHTLLQLGELRLASPDRDATLDTLRLAAAALAALGEADPAWARVHAAMARVELATRARSAALEDAIACESAGREHFRLNVQGLTTGEALRYARLRPRGLDLAIAALLAMPSADAAAVRRCWDALIRSRALVLDELALRRRGLAPGDTAAAAATLELRRASARLAHLVSRGGRGDSVGAWRLARDAAFARREQAELRLAKVSAAFRAARDARQIGLAAVEAARGNGEALVAYARIAPDDGAARYVAFVATSLGEVQWRPLGDAGRVDAAVDRWRRALGTPPTPDHLRDAIAECRAAGAIVRRLVWDPVAPSLGAASRVAIVADGALLTLPFEALPAKDGRPLVSSARAIRLLDTERDLATPNDTPAGRGLLAIGAPDFGCDSCGVAGPCGPGGRLRFHALPGAADEIRDVAASWTRAGTAEVERCEGACATVAALNARAAGHRALHVATHGWALEAPCDGESIASRRGVGRLISRPRADSVAADDIASSPLLASGLAFSPSGGEAGDGIVTADEIATLDLAGVELVVLSACETGLGTVRSGEGVLGLKRAFRIAGAEQLVTSLWSVDDRSTRDWMVRFHEAWLRSGHAADAARVATRGFLASVPPGDVRSHPFYWAAFVASGR